MITILRDRMRLIRWSKPLFRKHSLQFSTTSKGYLQTASILGNFEGGDILWEDLVKLTTCDRSSIKDRTLDVVARGSGNQSTLFLREVGGRVPSVKSRRGKWESESPIPTVCLGVTYVVVDTYGCDGGRTSPTRCAVIAAALEAEPAKSESE